MVGQRPTTTNSQISGLAAAPGLANDLVSGIGNAIVATLPPDIFLSLNYFEDPVGGLYIDSLEISNSGGSASISLIAIAFQSTGLPNCSNCVYGTGGDYAVMPGAQIYSPHYLQSIGSAVPPNSTVTIDLVPSGHENNPMNYFHPYENISVSGYISYSTLERFFPKFSLKSLPRTYK